jgi:integrase/recombinase XerD
MTYRRHLRACQHRKQGRRHWSCRCPIWFDAYLHGVRVQKSTGLTDWVQAQLLAEGLVNKSTLVSDVELPAPNHVEESISPEAAWDRFMAQVRMRDLSRASEYKYDLLRRQMLDFSRRRGIERLKDFDLDVLELFQAEWEEGPLTRLKKLERLKAFFRAAQVRRWIDENPAAHLRGPKVRLRPTMPFTQEEIQRILDATNVYPDKSKKIGRPNSLRLRAFILLLRYSGLRIGDVTSLSTDRVSGNRLFLYTQKTGQAVYCILPDFVIDALEKAPRLSDRYFFWTGFSSIHTVNGIWQRTLKSLFRLAGITNGHAHRFRDTFAVELLLSGVSTEEVATLLGHSNIAITQKHYSPWVRARQQQLESNLDRAWKRDPIVLLNAKTTTESTSDQLPRPN